MGVHLCIAVEHYLKELIVLLVLSTALKTFTNESDKKKNNIFNEL